MKNLSKKTILSFVILFFIAGMILSSYDCKAQVKENSRDNGNQTEISKTDLMINRDTDVDSFKEVSNDKFAINDKIIYDLHAKMTDCKKQMKDKYENKILQLDQKNTDLKLRMNDFKTESEENWQEFKAEFETELDKLVKSLNELKAELKI